MGMLSLILDSIFPKRCVFCRKPLKRGETHCCHDCAQSLYGAKRLRKGTFFDVCAAPFAYDGNVKKAIVRYKFQDEPGYASCFGAFLARTIREQFQGQYDLITWVPVSAERLKQRGYDQSMLIAMAAALELEDVAVDTLRKTVDNPAQSSLDALQRKSNVLGAYTVEDAILVEGKRILLIDDIITTGATLNEASRALLDAGAKRVICGAVAQTMTGSETDTFEVCND